MKHYGDITKINGAEASVIDIITGGSPCQDLSVAGKRAGLAGERSGLFMEQIRIVKEMRERERATGRTGWMVRPRYMVWENVPGAFSSGTPKGADFAAVIEEIIKVAEPGAAVSVCVPNGGWTKSGCYYAEDGSWSVAWRVHDAQFWGVPQRRKRIALVADFGGLSASEILFERKGLSGDSEQSGAKGEETAGGTGKSAEISVWCLQGNGIDRADTAGCNGKGWREDKCYTLNTIDRPAVYDAMGNGDEKTVCTITGDHQNRVTDYTALCVGNGQANQSVSDKAGALNTMHDQQAVMIALRLDNCSAAPIGGVEVSPTIRQGAGPNGCANVAIAAVDCRNGTENADINGTLQAKSSGGASYNLQNVCRTGQTVRRLTPLECERLQGYPDGWTSLNPISDMSDDVYAFWQNVLFEKNVRSGRIRQNEEGVWEIWHVKKIADPEGGDEEEDEWENTHKPYKQKTRKQMIAWYNRSFAGDSDSARYKALGNSIALPFWQWMARRICAQYERPATMASLFDGIGGFPLVFQRCGAVPVWASEIEEFPIAVTKVRFPDESV